ncbi:3-phosphoinositide-dependent protein kinase [Moesziomyces antarcticus T-34]|uniref:non-specific serine/threonine protein kinase n=1 Tax=Pseudozyma antarctica (strain T-34) TaxID=1151754 RepID=M9LSY7_PSEA3|nr:3-phosphoinositide-dependent protein kinase [Moesziomyces antarcticus T-34]
MDGDSHPSGGSGSGSGSAPAAMAPPDGPPPPHPSASDTPMSAPTPLQAPSATSSAAASRKSSLRSNAPPSSSASTTRIRKGLLSRAGSEAEDRSSRGASAAHNQLTTDDDDDELMISDSGPMPRRFASQNRGPMQTANSSRQSSQSSLPLSSWGSTALASSSQRSAAAALPHSPSHPSSSSSSIASGNRSGSGEASEGASSAGGVSLGRAMSVSSVSSVNSTSSLEAVPFRQAPLGNVRLGFGGAGASFRNAGRRNNPYGPLAMATQPHSSQQDFAQAPQSHHNDISAASIDLMAPSMSDSTPLAPADATAAPRASTSDRHRGVPKPASDAWMYRVGPGMRTNKPKAPSVAPEEPSDPSSEDLQSSSSAAKRSRDVLRQKFAKGAGRLGIKANIVTGLGPAASDLSTAFNPLDSSEDELNLVPPMRTPLPRSSSYFTSAPHTAGSTTGTPLHPALTPVPADFRTSSVTHAPLFVPKLLEDSYAAQEPGLTATPDVDEIRPHTNFDGGADTTANPFLTVEASGTDTARNARRRSSATNKPVLVRAESSSEAFVRVASPGLGIQDPSVVDASPARPALYTLSSANARAKNTPAADLIQASNGSASSPQPPTPAEVVRMEAQAGIASLPDSPSEPSPVPASYSPAAADEAVLIRRTRDFPSQPKLRRPSSGAGSEASLGGGSSAGTSRRPDSAQRQRLWSNSKRPAILRARTSESSISRRSHSLDRNRSSPAPQSPVEGPLSDAYYARSGTHSKSSSCSTAQGNDSANRAPPHVSVILEDDDSVNGDQLERSTVHGAGKVSPASPAPSGLDGDYQMALSPPSAGMLPLAVRPNPHSRSASPASQLARSPETIRLGPSRISDSLYGRSPASISLLRSPRLQSSSASIGSDRPSTPSQSRTTSTRGPNDFHFGETLGEGSYSTVLEAWDLLSGPSPKDPSVVDPNATSAAAAMVGSESARKRRRRIDLTGRKSYAVKVVDKVHILKQGKQKYVAIEKEALSRMIQCPGVVTLYWTFQDRESLYFVLELASNGELLNFIRKHGSFDAASARYYAAQLADTIDAMHRAGVVHRDVKPENILLDAAHRIKITDFGSAKIVHAIGETDVPTAKASAAPTPPPPQQTRAASFVGTAEYVSPELLVEKAQPAGKPADWWAFGCVLFQMLAGRPPFKGVNEYQTLQKVKNREFTFPQGFPDDAEELINRLLVLDPAERPSAAEIKTHRFFSGVDFDALWRVEAPKIKTGLVQPVPMPPRREFGNTSDFSFDEGFISSSDSQAYNGDTQSIDNQPHGGAEESSLSLDATSRSGADDADDSDMSDASSNVRDPRGEQRLPRRQSGLQRLADGFQSRFISNPGGSGTSSLPQGTSTAPRRKMASMSIDAAQPSENGNGGANYTAARGSRPFARSVQGTGGLSHSPSPTVREQQSQGGGDAGLASAVGLQQSWTALLLPKELMLYSTPVAQKKTGAGKMFTKRRQLVLTDFPRLLCVKETATALKVKSEVILALPSKAGGSDAGAYLDSAGSSSLTASHGGVAFERSSDRRASVRLDPEGGEEDEGAVALAQERPLQQAIPNLLTGLDFKGGKSFTIRVNNGRTFLYETLSGDASALVRYIQEARKPSA